MKKRILFILLTFILFQHVNVHSLSPYATTRINGKEVRISLENIVSYSIDGKLENINYDTIKINDSNDSSEIIIQTYAYKLNDLRYMNSDSFGDDFLLLLKNDYEISFYDVTNIFKNSEGPNYIWSRNTVPIDDSYKKLIYKDLVIGESQWEFSSLNSSFLSPDISFQICFVVPDYFVRIEIKYSDENDVSIVEAYPEYFNKNNGEYYWKSQEHQNNFYSDVINSDKTTEKNIATLKSVSNQIINTLYINDEILKNETKAFENTYIVNKDYNFDLPINFVENAYETSYFSITVNEYEYDFSVLYSRMDAGMSQDLLNLLKIKSKISQDDLLFLLSDNKPFTISNFYNFVDIKPSFEFLKLKNENIGECYFSLSKNGLLYNPYLTYTIRFINNSKIVEICISLKNKNQSDIYMALSSYIKKIGDYYYWNSLDDVYSFYQQLQRYNETFPQSFIEFQRTIDYIKSTLLLNGKNVSFVPESKSTIDTGIVNDDAVRLRTSPFLGEKSHVITLLSKNDKLTILDIGNYEEIDEYNAPWYKVKTENNQTGWIYGGYITR